MKTEELGVAVSVMDSLFLPIDEVGLLEDIHNLWIKFKKVYKLENGDKGISDITLAIHQLQFIVLSQIGLVVYSNVLSEKGKKNKNKKQRK